MSAEAFRSCLSLLSLKLCRPLVAPLSPTSPQNSLTVVASPCLRPLPVKTSIEIAQIARIAVDRSGAVLVTSYVQNPPIVSPNHGFDRQ